MTTQWVLETMKPELGCKGTWRFDCVCPKEVWGCDKNGVYQVGLVPYLYTIKTHQSQLNMGESCYIILCLCKL